MMGSLASDGFGLVNLRRSLYVMNNVFNNTKFMIQSRLLNLINLPTHSVLQDKSYCLKFPSTCKHTLQEKFPLAN